MDFFKRRRSIISIGFESRHRNTRELAEVVYLSLGLDQSRHAKLIALYGPLPSDTTL